MPSNRKRKASYGLVNETQAAPVEPSQQQQQPQQGQNNKRNGQVLSKRNVGGRQAGNKKNSTDNSEDDGGLFDDLFSDEEEEASSSGRGHANPTAWAERLNRLGAAFQGSREATVLEAIKYAPQIAAQKQKRAALLLQLMQQDIDAAYGAHKCCSHGTCGCDEMKRSTVKYMHLLYTAQLTIPTWRCHCCEQQFAPSAVSMGCFPSTPVDPDAWFDRDLLEAYTTLGEEEGVSGTGERRVSG
jgi:hypothetical protein